MKDILTYRKIDANRYFLVLIFLFTLNTLLLAQNNNTYTQQDRERSIRMEVRIEEMYKRFEQIDKRFEQVDKRFEQIDKRFEQVDKRFEQIDKRFEFMEGKYEWQFGLLLGAMFLLFGFILWDRRTFLKPFELKVEEMQVSIKTETGKIDKLLTALRELAKEDSKVAKVLKQFNLL